MMADAHLQTTTEAGCTVRCLLSECTRPAVHGYILYGLSHMDGNGVASQTLPDCDEDMLFRDDMNKDNGDFYIV